MTVGSISERNDSTRRFIFELCRTYPRLELPDIYKALYQSAFGCEHLLSDPSAAADYIKEEAMRSCELDGASTDRLIEPLDGDYCRVYLEYLSHGLTAETFARLFVMSAERQSDATWRFSEKLHVLALMAEAGEIPFSAAELSEYIAEKKQAGYPPCHHSDKYRTEYKPAYRLMKREFAAYLPLFARMDELLAVHANDSHTILVSIDGGSATGKSTLAELIERVYNCPIFHMDDFFLRPEQRTAERYAEPGGNVDRERFLVEVLEPIRRGIAVSYRRFDCSTLALKPPVSITPGRLCVIEGAYSMHKDLSPYYDLSVFLKIDSKTQRERIIKRNGDYAQTFFDKWIPLEMKYFDKMEPEKRCDIVIENSF